MFKKKLRYFKIFIRQKERNLIRLGTYNDTVGQDERLLERNTLEIKQLLKGGRIIVKYRKMLGFYLIVTILGLGLSFLNIAYLIKFTDDLFSKK